MIALACSTLSCDGFADSDFVESFRLLPEIGFKYVEFNCWYPRTITPARTQDLKRRCEATGLVPVVVYGTAFGGANNNETTKDVAHKLRLIDMACELGCRRICATGAARGTQGGLDAIVAVLREIVPYAEERDVLICLENHAGHNIETIADYEYILERIDSSHVGICLDTGHFDASGIDMNDVIDRFEAKINHIHLKENDGFGKKAFVRFGAGTTAIDQAVERLIASGYQGYLSVELSPTGEPERIPHDLSDALARFGKFATVN